MVRAATKFAMPLILALSFASAKKSANGLKTLAEVEAKAGHSGDVPLSFPEGLLHGAWANNRTFLLAARSELQLGHPVVIENFFDSGVALRIWNALEEHIDAQSDATVWAQSGPFKAEDLMQCFDPELVGPELEIGVGGRAGAVWARKDACAMALHHYLHHDKASLFSGSRLLLETTESGSDRSLQVLIETEMRRPALRSFFRGLMGLPAHASGFTSAWNWLRPGDYYSLHTDNVDLRYLSLSVHFARGWPRRAGGEFLWCAPGGNARDLDVRGLVGGPRVPSDFNVTRDGSYVSPGFNTAVVFPVSRSSAHAVAPVLTEDGRRFTFQGWYLDPCGDDASLPNCARAFERFEAWKRKTPSAQPLTHLGRLDGVLEEPEECGAAP